jgi:hypothetical protein
MDRLRNLLCWLLLPAGVWGVVAGVDLQTDPNLPDVKHPAHCRGCRLGTQPLAADVALGLPADP